MSERRYRIERVVDDDGSFDGWDIGIYEDGAWVGACGYETFAEAVTAYNEYVRER